MKQKNLFLTLCLMLFSLSMNAQIVGSFILGNDGHIYFQATNQSIYSYIINVKATSNDREAYNNYQMMPGNTLYIGPNNDWQWYWKQNDIITITYSNGQYVFWKCPQNDKIYFSTPNFTGRVKKLFAPNKICPTKPYSTFWCFDNNNNGIISSTEKCEACGKAYYVHRSK